MSPGVAGYSALLGGAGGLHELACGSNNASRLPPPRLCCSTTQRARGKASDSERLEQSSCDWARSKPDQSVNFIRMVFGGRACKLRRFSRAPSEALSSGEGPGVVGEDCLRLGAAKPSSAAARRFEQRKGVGVADRVSWGRLLFGYFFLAKQEKVRPRVRRGTRRLRKVHPPVNGGTQRLRTQTPRVRRRTSPLPNPHPPLSGRKQHLKNPPHRRAAKTHPHPHMLEKLTIPHQQVPQDGVPTPSIPPQKTRKC